MYFTTIYTPYIVKWGEYLLVLIMPDLPADLSKYIILLSNVLNECITTADVRNHLEVPITVTNTSSTSTS